MFDFTPLDLCGFLWLIWVTYWFIASRFVQQTKSSEGYLLRLQHLLPLATAFVLIFQGYRWMEPWNLPSSARFVGVALTGAGMLFAVWARVHLGRYWSGMVTLKVDHKLIRTGPYGRARHPIYTGVISALLGSAIAASAPLAFLGFLVAWLSFRLKIEREEKLLRQTFGDEYVRFQREVPRLIPRL